MLSWVAVSLWTWDVLLKLHNSIWKWKWIPITRISAAARVRHDKTWGRKRTLRMTYNSRSGHQLSRALSATSSPANITFESGPPVFTKNSFFFPFTVPVTLKVDEKPEPPYDWISGEESCNERASMIAGSIFDAILYLALDLSYNFFLRSFG